MALVLVTNHPVGTVAEPSTSVEAQFTGLLVGPFSDRTHRLVGAGDYGVIVLYSVLVPVIDADDVNEARSLRCLMLGKPSSLRQSGAKTMRGIIYNEYGEPDVLEFGEIDRPMVEDDMVLVRVRATSVNPLDWHWVTGLPYFSRMQFGLFKPKVHGLGADMAGQVEAVGKNVTQFQPGDEVFGDLSECGLGAYAEYVCAPENALAAKPANLTFEQAAAVPLAANTALQGLRDHGQIQPGQRVLINGASGGVGTFAVQIAKSFGAEVVGVCSTRNVDMVRSIGADKVIDYTQEDFTHSKERYHLILDLVGNRSPSECRRVLTPTGVYLASFGQPDHRWLGPLAQMLRTLLLSPFVSQKMTMFVMKPNPKDLVVLKELLESGNVTPVIDRTYQLSETPDALRYLEKGHAQGKVVVTV